MPLKFTHKNIYKFTHWKLIHTYVSHNRTAKAIIHIVLIITFKFLSICVSQNIKSTQKNNLRIKGYNQNNIVVSKFNYQVPRTRTTNKKIN